MLCQTTGLYVPDPSVKCFSLYPALTFSGVAEAFGQFKLVFGAIFDPSGWSRTVDGQVVGSGWSLVGTLDFLVVVISSSRRPRPQFCENNPLYDILEILWYNVG